MGKKHTLLLGAHTSIAGGLEKAITRGESIDCSCIQIFTKSNRQWYAKKLTNEEIELFKETVKKSTIDTRHIVVHASYLINIGSSDGALGKKSVAALADELERCELLGIPGLVLHPGAHVRAGEEVTLKIIAQNLDAVFEQVPGHSKILLETMAGQGSVMCYTFEHIAEIIKLSNHKNRIGVCLDTCHVFAAGYDLRTQKTYEALWQKFDEVIGLQRLHAIHLNDSKKELGSRVDRHADIGKGEIGLEAFRLLFNDERFFDIPKILETPETTEIMEDYARNMTVIKGLLTDKTKKLLQV